MVSGLVSVVFGVEPFVSVPWRETWQKYLKEKSFGFSSQLQGRREGRSRSCLFMSGPCSENRKQWRLAFSFFIPLQSPSPRNGTTHNQSETSPFTGMPRYLSLWWALISSRWQWRWMATEIKPHQEETLELLPHSTDSTDLLVRVKKKSINSNNRLPPPLQAQINLLRSKASVI